jgi:hypothetical protein
MLFSVCLIFVSVIEKRAIPVCIFREKKFRHDIQEQKEVPA